MSLFQLLLFGISGYFAYQVYKHIQNLEDNNQTATKPFDDGGINSDIKEFTPKTIYSVEELLFEADEALKNNNLDKALMILREANYKKPYDGEILYKIGYILYMKEDYKNSIEALEDALKGDDKDGAIYSLMASNYRKMKNYIKASQNIQTAISLEPQNPIYHFNYANILQDLNHKEEAIEQYKKALELKPDFKEAKEELEKLDETKRDI